MSLNTIRHSSILKREETALLIIDIQEKIFRVMLNSENVIKNAMKLIEAFKILGSPIFATEQYPKGLGDTEPRVKDALKNVVPYKK